MGVRSILIMALIINAVAEEDPSIKCISKADCVQDDDAISNIKTEENQAALPTNISAEDYNDSKTIVLFKPYISEGQDYVEGIDTTINSRNLKQRIFTLPRREGKATNIDSIKNANKTSQNVSKVENELIKGEDSSKNVVTSEPFARYEITENVIDVPDDRTPAGPIVTNYTPYKNTPLNLGTPQNIQNITEVKNEVGDENNKNTRSRFSLLHINAEYDEKPVNNQSKISTFFKGVKQYFSGIKSEVVNGIHKLFRKDDDLPHGKSFDDSHEDSDDDEENDEDDDDDDFRELHRTIHKGFK